MNITIDLVRLFAGFFLQIFPSAYLCTLPFKGNMRMRHPQTLTYSIIIGMALIFSIAGTAAKCFYGVSDTTFNISNAIFMLLFAVCVIYFCVIVKAPAAKKLFVICFVAIFAFFISLMTSVIWDRLGIRLFGPGYIDDDPYSVGYTVFLLLFTSVVFPLAYYITKRYVIPMLEVLDNTELAYVAAMSILMLLLLSFGFAVTRTELIAASASVFICLVLCIAVGSVYTVSFIFVRKLKEQQQLRIDILRAEHTNNMAQEQYKHICENIESQRQLRHNFRQQLITLRGLCDEQPEKVQEYLAEYIDHIPEYSITPVCTNAVLNSIISYYKSTAETEGFTFKCNVKLPAVMNVPDYDLVTILGNLLENALDVGRLLPKDKRLIIVNIGYSHKMLGITVDNSFDGNLIAENGNFISTKHDHDALGLKSVKNIADKYNGSASFESRGGMFYSAVMLTNNSRH